MGFLSGFGNYLGFGQPGTYAENSIPTNVGYQNIQAAAGQENDPRYQAALTALLNGQGMGGINALQGGGNLAASDPRTASLYAANQVEGNPLYAGIYGDKGYNQSLLNENNQIANTPWTLTPQDTGAYSQAAGDTARMFASSGNSLQNELAARGLGSGDNNVAGAAFSGLAGNKNEMLANSQRQIADARYAMNLNRLNSVRSQITNQQQQAMNDLGQQEGENNTALNQWNNTNQNALNAGLANQNEINNQWNEQQSTKTPTFGQMLGSTLTQAFGNMAGGMIGQKGNAKTNSAAGNQANTSNLSSNGNSASSMSDMGASNVNAGSFEGSNPYSGGSGSTDANGGASLSNSSSSGPLSNVSSDVGLAEAFYKGGIVPGKARLPGDNPQNDTVPIMASPGEGIVSRSNMPRARLLGLVKGS